MFFAGIVCFVCCGFLEELNAQWDVFAASETSLAEFVENVLPHNEQGLNPNDHRDLTLGKSLDEKGKSNGCRKLSAEAVAVRKLRWIL